MRETFDALVALNIIPSLQARCHSGAGRLPNILPGVASACVTNE